jgi:hypothetical protein
MLLAKFYFDKIAFGNNFNNGEQPKVKIFNLAKILISKCLYLFLIIESVLKMNR